MADEKHELKSWREKDETGFGWPVVESNWFGDIPAPTTFGEFSGLMETHGFLLCRGWRGQEDYRWRLDSSAVRRLQTLGVPEVTPTMLATYDDLLLKTFRKRRLREADRIETDLEALAAIQHYGGATRLLDFTENVFIALWFACRGDKDTPGMLFGISGDDEEILDLTSPNNDEEDRRPIDQLLGDRRLRIWKASALYDRMRVQQSIFAFDRGTWYDFGSLHPWPGEEQLSRAILVTPELKKAMVLLWDTVLGLSEEVLFPDLAGFGQSHRVEARLAWSWMEAIADAMNAEEAAREALQARIDESNAVNMERFRQMGVIERDIDALDGDDWDHSF